MTKELKPCPFCDSIELRGRDYVNRAFEVCYEIFCLNCDAIIRGYTESEVITAWNTRAEPDALPEWFMTQINESIIDCELLEAELKDDNDIEEAVRVSRRANTLRWVLSLRKPEEKNE